MVKRIIIVILAAFFTVFAKSYAQTESLVIASYSLVNFPAAKSGDLAPYLTRIFREIRPDVIGFQQIKHRAGVGILESALQAGTSLEYTAAEFVDGDDSDNALLFRSDRLILLSQKQIDTSLRDISRYELALAKAPGFTSFFVYLLHLKAGSSLQDQSRRRAEMKMLREDIQTLPPESSYLICGDFNSRESTDSAFVDFISFTPNTHNEVFDPIMSPGVWNSNPAFARIHTQSTHATSTTSYAAGGMDDRFDMILGSKAMLQPPGFFYIDSSYYAFGQDGKHFNQSINDALNGSVPDSIAEALYRASDHLPVVLKIGIGPELSEVAENKTPIYPEVQLLQNYPNPSIREQ